MLAVCQFEYGISFLDYYWGVERDREKADWAWDTFVLGHAQWWETPAGRAAAAAIRSGGERPGRCFMRKGRCVVLRFN